MPTELVLFNVHGARALRYDAAAGRLAPLGGADRPRRSGFMPQQCARDGAGLVCTPLPVIGGFGLRSADLAIGPGGTLATTGTLGFALPPPIGEGLAIVGGAIYVAGNAALGDGAGCGLAGAAVPCSTRGGGQRVYVYGRR